jgi:hypothetical protein
LRLVAQHIEGRAGVVGSARNTARLRQALLAATALRVFCALDAAMPCATATRWALVVLVAGRKFDALVVRAVVVAGSVGATAIRRRYAFNALPGRVADGLAVRHIDAIEAVLALNGWRAARTCSTG